MNGGASRVPDAMTRNAQWAARSRTAVWHPCTQMKHHERTPPLAIARASGAWLHDYEGGRYLDAIGSWWVNLFGHANPRINAALAAQLDDLEHVMLAGFTHACVVELSERLAALAPGLSHAFYGSDGASATEIALKMSFHYWRQRGLSHKDRYVRLEGGYHGETVGALSVTDVAIFRDAYAPLLREHPVLASPAVHEASGSQAAMRATDEAIAALERFLGQHADTTAALIVEPLVQGARGMAMYAPRYLAAARELTKRHRVHLIADEIMTGFGRTGTMFACEQAGIAPDLMCLSKGITGGYLPLSCVLASDEVFDAFYDDDVTRGFLHSHSYTGNALACRAALAVLDIFEEDDVIAANRERAARWRGMAGKIAAHPRARGFRQCGMIVAFEVDGADGGWAARFATEALRREIVLRPIGNSVYFMPPYTTDDDEFAFLVDRTIETIDAT